MYQYTILLNVKKSADTEAFSYRSHFGPWVLQKGEGVLIWDGLATH